MARVFDRTNSDSLVGDPFTFPHATYTYAFWIMVAEAISGSDNRIPIMFESASPVGEVDFQHDGTSGAEQAIFAHYTAASPAFVTAQLTTTMSTAQWYVLTARWDGGQLSVYLNGALEAQTGGGLPDPVASSEYRLNVGCTAFGGARFWSGRVAEIALWTAALEDAEIAAYAKGASPLLIRPHQLAQYWPLIGRTSPEVELLTADSLVVDGALAAEHPPITYPPKRWLRTSAAVAAAGQPFWRRFGGVPHVGQGQAGRSGRAW